MDGNPADVKFVQARDHWAGLHSPPLGLTLHDMEAPEKGTTAESVAVYFQHPSRTGSAHYCADENSTVQCVRDTEKAAHAPGVNSTHLGVEQAGYAAQSRGDWKDPYSWAMIQDQVVPLLQAKCDQYGIPKVGLSVEDLKSGNVRGITTHARVTLAFHRSTHTDPGEGYPFDEVIAMVVNGAHTVAPPKPTGFKPGDHGAGVHFYQAMLNIEAPRRINSKGKSGGGQLKLTTDPAKAGYGPKTEEATREIQRFINVMLHLQGKPPIKVTGIADPFTVSSLAYWVNQDTKH